MVSRKLSKQTCKTEGCIRFAKYNWGGFCDKCRENQHFKAVRFLDKAKEFDGDDCLEWPHSKDRAGYGAIGIEFEGKRYTRAPRLLCVMVNGAPESDKIDTAHSCGNPGCVNPKHLRWATPKENMADKVIHGTNGQKLTNDDVRRIRAMRGRKSGKQIAKEMGVTEANISRIFSGKIWSNLK